MRKHIFYNMVNFQPVTFRILFFRGIQTLQMRLSRKACFWWTQLLRPFCRAADKFCPLVAYSQTSFILKVYIRDKWVCSTEPSGSTVNLSSILLRYIVECGLSGPTGKCTIWKFERSPRTCLGPQAMFACPLDPLYSHSAKRCMDRN